MTGNSGAGSLIVMKAISEKIPKTVKIDVTMYQYQAAEGGKGKLVLRGETDGYASVQNIIEAMKGVPILTEVTEKSSNVKPGTEGVIEFTLNANYIGSFGSQEKQL